MNIVEYKDSNFEEIVTLVDDFAKHIVDLDTKHCTKKFSSIAEAEAYTRQIVTDAIERDGCLYVAKENDRIIGFIMGIINKNDKDLLYKLSHAPFWDGWIGEWYVKPEFRNKGIGKLLMAKANEYFKSKGCRFSRLYVLADNVDSIEVYKRLGFEVRDLEMAKEL